MLHPFAHKIRSQEEFKGEVRRYSEENEEIDYLEICWQFTTLILFVILVCVVASWSMYKISRNFP